jgi:alpha-tubulin suppressor-like RCC1 family protein
MKGDRSMRRLLSLLLACALLLPLLPAVAAVEGGEAFQTAPCVSFGKTHVAALKADGTVWTLGDNSFHQLGYPSSGTVDYFTQVPGLERVTDIATGLRFTLALTDDGSLWAWGNNSSGQLGDGTTTTRTSPSQVALPDGLRFTALSVDAQHVVALSTDGEVYAWGQGGAGLTASVNPSPVKIEMPEGVKVTSIATSAVHTLALGEDHGVYAWGDNTYGQLGTGGTVSSDVPVLAYPAEPTYTRNAVGVAVAGSQVSIALTSDERLYMTGKSSNGLLEQNYVNFSFYQFSYIESVSASSANIVALDKYGKLYTWGKNDQFQLGHNVSTSNPIYSSQVALDPGRITRAWTGEYPTGKFNIYAMTEEGELHRFTGKKYAPDCRPVLDGSEGEPFNLLHPAGHFQTTPKIVSGDDHTVALTANGAVWAWGKNDHGQLGDGTTTDRPYAVRVSGLEHVVDLSAGGSTTMALKADGTLWAWGRNDSGQLGNNSLKDSSVPVQVSAPAVGWWITDIANGGVHSLALTSSRDVYAWGNGSYGQLGSSTGFLTTPQKVDGVEDIGAIAAGGYSSLASTARNAYSSVPSLNYSGTVIYYWGKSQGGDYYSSSTPKTLSYSNSGFTSHVATSGYHSFAYGYYGGCWGKNDYGQLGLKQVSPYQQSAVINYNLPYSTVLPSPSGNFTLGLKAATGKLELWGADPLLGGDGTLTAITTPTVLAGVDQVIAAAAGRNHIAAVSADGSVWTRGENSYGQLGNGQTDSQYSDFSDQPVIRASGEPLSLSYSESPVYLLSATAEGGHGELLGSPTNDYAQGDAISVTVQAHSGWIFSHWEGVGVSLDDPQAETVSFSMPAHSVSLTAKFEKDLAGMNPNGGFLTEPGAPEAEATPIATPEELAQIGTDPAFPLSGSYVLTADLDLSTWNGGQWTPLASPSAPFTGTLDGQGHVIRNMTITGSMTHAGLFAKVDSLGTVKNLGLEDVSISLSGSPGESCYVGGIAGKFGEEVPTVSSTKAALTNCYVTGKLSADLYGYKCSLYLGGLAGVLAGDASLCSNRAALSGVAGSSNNAYIGGIAGQVLTYLVRPYSIRSCANDGPISPGSTSQAVFAGGIVGYQDLQVTLTQCYNSADVWLSPASFCGSFAYLGGIAGFSDDSISNCYNLGDIGGNQCYNQPHNTMVCGGIAGQFVPSDTGKTYAISNCYTTGKVIARAYSQACAGGIVGDVKSSSLLLTVKNCLVLSPEISAYYDFLPGSTGGSGPFQADVVGHNILASGNVRLSGIETNGYGTLQNASNATSITMDWAKQPESYTDGLSWNLEAVWAMDPAQNGGLPYLAWNSDYFELLDYRQGVLQVYSRLPATQVTACAALYDEAGKLIALHTISSDLAGGVNELPLPLASQDGRIKIFLWRSTNLKPLSFSFEPSPNL